MTQGGRVLPPQMTHSESPKERSGSIVRDVVLIVVLLGVITVLHLFTNTSPSAMSMHMLYRRLYYLPIMYAGFVFGRRGGLITALAATLLFAPHAQLSLGGLFGANIDNLYEIVMYIAVGSLFGWLRDLEEVKTADLRQVSSQLEDAYRKLEERAIQLINIQDYTQSILRSITSGVITVGPDGSVATANPAAERMLGMREVDMVPRRIGMLFSDDGGLDQDVVKVLEGPLPRMVRDVRMVSRAGRTLHVQLSTSRMRDIDGRILGAVVTLEDVSEVKALTDQLIRADRLAAMGELTAGVAHEVRNPLGIIRASVQLLEDPDSGPLRTSEAASVIKQEIDRLDRVIKALLDFGRPSRPTLMATAVTDVLSDVVLFTRRFASQSHVQIEEQYPAQLPDVIADADQLKQVFVNLISNAVQAMEDTGGTIRVKVDTDDAFVSVSVIDDGPGIDTEDLSKVFDPFYSTRDAGTGLGLTMVHRIVDDHNGHIEVASEPGAGTRFTVSLPVSQNGSVSR
ncbi:MAG: PAS domain-containing protein [Coriobacteriia bacterium]|nr:PAS domain-containing protein [Coriobacteriia bacterium]MBN2823070.1 PAS domain-containing protein [Coriobacteriia bacterium]